MFKPNKTVCYYVMLVLHASFCPNYAVFSRDPDIGTTEAIHSCKDLPKGKLHSIPFSRSDWFPPYCVYCYESNLEIYGMPCSHQIQNSMHYAKTNGCHNSVNNPNMNN